MNQPSPNMTLNQRYYDIRSGKIVEMSMAEILKGVPVGLVLLSEVERGKMLKVLPRWNKY